MPLSVLAAHVLTGVLVLACFWGALLARKGSPTHKAWGRTYLLLLAPIIISVLPISLHLAASSDAARLSSLGTSLSS